MTAPVHCINGCGSLAAERRRGLCHRCYAAARRLPHDDTPGTPDLLAATQCADGLIPYLNLRLTERTLAVHILADRGLSLEASALRLGIDQRNISYQRAKPRPNTTTPARLAYTPPEATMTNRSIDEIAGTAQNLCDDLAGYPDLNHVLANAELIAENEPRFAAQIMLALAAWVPVDDTLNDRKNREEQLRRQRIAEGLPTLDALPSAHLPTAA